MRVKLTMDSRLGGNDKERREEDITNIVIPAQAGIQYLIALLLLLLFLLPNYTHAQMLPNYNYSDNDDYYVGVDRSLTDGLDKFKMTISDKIYWLDINIPYCHDIYTNLSDCIPSICKENFEGILNIREIQGIKEDQCAFREMFMYQGILTCSFKPEENLQIISLLDRIHNNIDFKLKEGEVESVKKFYAVNCRLAPQDKYMNAVMISEDKYQVALDDAMALFTYEPVLKQARTTLPQAENALFEAFRNDFWYNNSLIFYPAEYKLVLPIAEAKKALSAKRRASTGQNLANSRELKITSLVYVSNTKWTVWINNNKITSEGNNQDVKVLNIDSDKVKLAWTINQIDALSSNWRSNYKNASNELYVSADGKNVIRKINDNQHILEFQLKAGESLNLDNMLTQKEEIR